MLQDAKTIRYYQRLSDGLAEQWNRGYRTDELRLYVEGYLAAMRHSDALEPFLVHRLEEEITRFLHDSSNFALPETQSDVF